MVYGVRYYYWIPRSLRKHTRDFYLGKYGSITLSEYIENENALLILIHNTKDRDYIKNCTTMKPLRIARLLKETFG